MRFSQNLGNVTDLYDHHEMIEPALVHSLSCQIVTFTQCIIMQGLPMIRLSSMCKICEYKFVAVISWFSYKFAAIILREALGAR